MTKSHPTLPRLLSRLSALLSLCCLAWLAVLPLAAAEATKIFDVPAGEAVETLRLAAQQAGKEIMFPAETVRGVQTAAVKGEFAPLAAFNRMLADTPLMVVQDEKTGAYAVSRVSDPNGPRAVATERARPESKSVVEDGVVKMDAFEVFGSKSINADKPRTRDDVQPYVVFGREQIQNSPALNLEDFFRARLPMNQANPGTQAANGIAAVSSVDLRGLGSNQTLILLDGRRLAARGSSSGLTSQADLNGIPLSMIERIEILPATASGIYGGSATGGVINIITRKDFSGVEVAATYGNTFDTDVANRRLDVNGSFNLEGGKTMLTFNYSYSDANELLVQDRDFPARSRALILANNPAGVLAATTPPLGYLPNIRSQNGANLVLKNGTPLNSPITHIPVGYAGPASDGGAALVANAGRYDLGFPVAYRGLLNSFQSTPVVESFGFGLRRRFGDRVEAYLDASRFTNDSKSVTNFNPVSTTIAANAPNNPFTSAINVSYPNLASPVYSLFSSLSERLTGGVMVRLPAEWTAGLDYVYSTSESRNFSMSNQLGDPDGTGPGISYATALSNGTLNVLRDLYANPLNLTPYYMPDPISRMTVKLVADEWTLRGSGPLVHLPAGPITLSTSVQHRTEEIPGFVQRVSSATDPAGTYRYNAPVDSQAQAYYAELRIPVFNADSGVPFVKGLELQASVRRDDFTLNTRATTTLLNLAGPDGPIPTGIAYVERDYTATKMTVGFKYTVTDDLALRASYGTGFLPPSLNQLSQGLPSTFTPGPGLLDYKRGNQPVGVSFTTLGGGSPDLRPEESESTSAGLVFTPRILPGLRLSLDYTRIVKTDEIGSLGIVNLYELELFFPERITRAPLTPADQALGYTGGVITFVNQSSLNLAGKRLTAWDLQADYSWKTPSWGDFQFYSVATYQPQLQRKPVPNAPWIDMVGFAFSPVKWKGNVGLNWNRGPWSAGWNAQYYHSHRPYFNNTTPASAATTVLNQGSDTIPSQMYHDLSVSYRWGAQPTGWARFLAQSQLTVTVQNVFDTSPPIMAAIDPFFGTSSFSNHGDPRLRRYTLSVRKQF